MGKDTGSSALKNNTTPAELPPQGTFRIRVVEHISWDSYDEEKKVFLAGHKTNKPIADREFKITLPKGEIITKRTDKNGVIELAKYKTTDEFKVTFKPSSAESLKKHNLFYNKSALVKKVENDSLIVKSNLMCGGDHQLSILRYTVIIDSHMHIQSARCAPIKWVQNLSFITKGLERKTIEGIAIKGGYFTEVLNTIIPLTWFFRLPFTGNPIRDLPQQGRKSTRESGDDYIKEVKAASIEYLGKEKLYTGLSKLFMAGIVMTMDMEYAHVDGYYGLKIYNPLYESKHAETIKSIKEMQVETSPGVFKEIKRDKTDGYDDFKIYQALYKDKDEKLKPKGYWFPVHGKWVEETVIVNMESYETLQVQRFEEVSRRDETRYTKIETEEPAAVPINLEEYKQGMGKDNIKVNENLRPGEKRKIEQIVVGTYFDAKKKITTPVKVLAVPVLASDDEVSVYEQWERQQLYTEISVLKYPLQLLPMFHYDPRRWQTYGKSGNEYPMSQVAGKGLYIGFKMYTAQGYKPLDPRLPIMEDFYVRCCKAQIPIMNHGTPGGASTYEKEEFINFFHLNDSEEDRYEQTKQKQKIKNKDDAEAYFDEQYVSPYAWEKMLNKEIKLYDENGNVREEMNFKKLRLCLAHFGGPTKKGLEWNKKTIEMITAEGNPYPNLYTDISSSFADEGFRDHFQKIIADKANERLKDRVIFGTDWYMTFLYEPKTLTGKHFEQYCRDTKKCLDEVDLSLWPRFTQINPYTFYRLDREILRISENIIEKRSDEDVRNFLVKLDQEDIDKIRREAAYLSVANTDYLTIQETIPT